MCCGKIACNSIFLATETLKIYGKLNEEIDNKELIRHGFLSYIAIILFWSEMN
jgi:hypothetical protein